MKGGRERQKRYHQRRREAEKWRGGREEMRRRSKEKKGQQLDAKESQLASVVTGGRGGADSDWRVCVCVYAWKETMWGNLRMSDQSTHTSVILKGYVATAADQRTTTTKEKGHGESGSHRNIEHIKQRRGKKRDQSTKEKKRDKQ